MNQQALQHLSYSIEGLCAAQCTLFTHLDWLLPTSGYLTMVYQCTRWLLRPIAIYVNRFDKSRLYISNLSNQLLTSQIHILRNSVRLNVVHRNNNMNSPIKKHNLSIHNWPAFIISSSGSLHWSACIRPWPISKWSSLQNKIIEILKVYS